MALTDYISEPYPWQVRCYERFLQGDYPEIISAPTGAGKTAVMRIWYAALRDRQALYPDQPPINRRLVWCVDRRSVVDQAEEEAERLVSEVGEAALSVYALRGGRRLPADWRSLTEVAIIVGTVDMLGSRLLFSGYGCGNTQSVDAAVLGTDSLWILDEAHCSQAFATTLTQLRQSIYGVRSIFMSATSVVDAVDVLTVSDEDFEHPTLGPRLNAKRVIHPQTTETLIADAATLALQLADNEVEKRVVVFVQSPDTARRILTTLQGTLRREKRLDAVQLSLLTGEQRGYERSALGDGDMLRFKTSVDPDPSRGAILVATSAGEVGIDLYADHAVTDVTTAESHIQRLGRVNRAGQVENGSRVYVLCDKPLLEKGPAAVALRAAADPDASDDDSDEDGDEADSEVVETGVADGKRGKKKKPPKISQSDLRLAARYDTWRWLCDWAAAENTHIPRPCDAPDAARAPQGRAPVLDRHTFELYAATSMPDTVVKPAVSVYLHGINPDIPMTTLVWRRELSVPGFTELSGESLRLWFRRYAILPHERLQASTERVVDFLAAWAEANGPAIAMLDTGSGLRRFEINGNKRMLTEAVRNASLVLPAAFGLVDPNLGFLTMPGKFAAARDNDCADLASALSPAPVRYREVRSLVQADAEAEEDLLTRIELLSPERPPMNRPRGFTLRLPNGASLIAVRDTTPGTVAGDVETLLTHSSAVQAAARRTCEALQLPEDSAFAVSMAAYYHDAGKNSPEWQAAIGGVISPSFSDLRPETLAKGPDLGPLAGFRHEYASLAAVEAAGFCDLTQHLVVAHHGRGRPWCDGHPGPAVIAERYDMLTGLYGYYGLARLEAIVRLADWEASGG